ncbi:MAG TPA: thioredoxin domain-containing protein [Polyangiaceae bacterium]|nr:thioredoxin domain-containing protein [Polyangiaceae bacterium]
MSSALDGLVFDGFRAVARSGRRAGAAVYTARSDSDGGNRARLVVLPGFTGHEGPRPVLERASRYGAGIRELVALLNAGRLPRSAELGASDNELWVAAFRAHAAETLDDALGNGLRLSPATIAELIGRIGSALGALHDQGVVHGHLRADLIAVTHGDPAVVEGFGLGQLGVSVSPQFARDILPAEYRAPELRGGSPARPTLWSDVYAFGVLSWEMLAARRASGEDAPSLRELGEQGDSRLQRLLMAALADSSSGRPSDVRAWANELAALIAALASGRPEAEPVSALPSPIVSVPAPQDAPQESPPMTPDAGLEAPAPQLEEPPTQAPPPVPPPQPQTPAASGSRAALWLVSCIVLGTLLMCGGAGGLFAYRVMNNKRSSFPVPTTSTPVATTSALPAPSSSAPAVGSDPTETDPEEPPFDPETPHDAGAAAEFDEERPPPKARPPNRAELRVQHQDALSPLPLDASVPVLGRREAPVTWVIFGDLECPYTRRLLRNLLRLQRQKPAHVRLAWRHRPLSEHEHARVAADFAATLHASAGDESFWRFAAQVAAAEKPASVPELELWLERAGIERKHWQGWLASPVPSEHVARDLSLAGQYNVRNTPTSFVNGLRVEGSKPYAELSQIVERERGAAMATLASGTEPGALYLTRTKKNLINLGADVAQRACPKVGKSPARGARDALVTIVEFADFECEYCKRVEPTLNALLARYPDTLRHVWKNFPLEQHARAKPAAVLAVEIHEQRGERQFWQAHAALFKAAPNLSDAALLDVARDVALGADVARESLRRTGQSAAVLRDVALGEKLGVSGTPTFFVNGRRLAGARPQQEFRKLIDEELKIAQRLLKSGTARENVYRVLCGAP